MGIGGIGIWQLLIILLIVVMLFGTKKLRNLGSDLGGAMKGFKTAMKDDDESEDDSESEDDGESTDDNTEKSVQADTEEVESAEKKEEA